MTNAELHRRSREWLSVESSDAGFNASFESAKRSLTYDAEHVLALIAIGEFKAARALLRGAESDEIFRRLFAASGEGPFDTAPLIEPPAAPGDPITRFVFGTLGYAPDAPKGRLRLRPKFPEGWSSATIDNIHIGDALITLQYTRTPQKTAFEIEQIAGAMPVRLILEPVLYAPITAASVDGVDADLNFAPVPEGLVAPVQIMLDARRTFELTTKNPPF